MPKVYDERSPAEISRLCTRLANRLAAEHQPAEEHANVAEVLLRSLAMGGKLRQERTPYSAEVWRECLHFLSTEVASMPQEDGATFAMYLLAQMLAGELDTSRPWPPKRHNRPSSEPSTRIPLRAVS